MRAEVSIIIPTTCEAQRKQMLWRAIRSVRQQNGSSIRIIVVVNGKRFDSELLSKLRADRDLHVIYQTEASSPLAQKAGRRAVSTPFFGFLDDDDEYLPEAIRCRLEPMLRDPSIDAVVTNGIRKTGDVEHLNLPDLQAARVDPLYALLSYNWLTSCGALYRSAGIGENYFDAQADYFEWTMLAIRIACDKKHIYFLDDCTFRVNVTPGSVSASDKYYRAEPVFLQSVLRLPLPGRVRRGMRKKLSASYHVLAELSLGAGQIRQARQFHFRSILLPGGIRYLLYSRKVLLRRVP